MSEAEAKVLEQERANGLSADERLLALFLANVKGDGREAARIKAEKAMTRVIKRLRDERGGQSFTGLVLDLIKTESAARGWL